MHVLAEYWVREQGDDLDDWGIHDSMEFEVGDDETPEALTDWATHQAKLLLGQMPTVISVKINTFCTDADGEIDQAAPTTSTIVDSPKEKKRKRAAARRAKAVPASKVRKPRFRMLNTIRTDVIEHRIAFYDHMGNVEAAHALRLLPIPIREEEIDKHIARFREQDAQG